MLGCCNPLLGGCFKPSQRDIIDFLYLCNLVDQLGAAFGNVV